MKITKYLAIAALVLAPALSGATIISASGAGGTIDDSTPLSSTISIATDELITSLSVTLTGLEHTWAGDLTATLTNGATTVTLFERPGLGSAGPCSTTFGCSTNLEGNFIFNAAGADFAAAVEANHGGGSGILSGGTFGALGDLTAFLMSGGDWTLDITDSAAGDDGALVIGWTLDIETQDVGPQPMPEPGILVLLGFGLAGLGFARRRS